MTGVIQQSGVPLQKVIIKYPEEDKQRKNSNKLEFEVDDACATAFPHIAKKTKTATIACNLAHIINSSSTVHFFCKVGHSECSPSRGVSITPTSRGFNITIRHVTPKNQGEYWCGLKENTKISRENKSYSAALKKILLLVEDIKYFERSRTIGHNVSFYCNYADSPAVVDSFSKFICKGDDPRVCQTIVNSSTPENKRFSMKDEKDQRNIIVTMRELTVKDSGSYWCGAETSDGEGGKIFFNRLSLTVDDSSQAHIIVIICLVVLLLLLFLTVSVLTYKRCSASKNSAAPNRNNTKEDYIYEEIQVGPLMPDSGTTTNTIYATAALPTADPASLHYATVNIQRRPDRDSDDPKIHKNESCQYAAVKCRQSAASS
ncbi:CMRF35-like molecule 8 isoform X4 [Salarias fasciatus]|nr:CMRF35-like molecule 8 isoform X4 [Salarias fasciatus]